MSRKRPVKVDDAKVLALREQKLTLSVIAQRLGLSIGGVQHSLDRSMKRNDGNIV